MKSTSSRLCAGAFAVAVVFVSAASAEAQGRHGSRHNDGAVVAGALLGGLVIGGIIANSAAPPPAYAYSPPAYAAPNPHVDWCYRHTPGYNPYDNTYQGYYAGERVYCRSPYGG